MSDAYRLRSKNTILVKDDVGRAKPTCYDLPHEAHAYGRAEPADMEGAREVTMHWASHVPRPKPGENCQDFKKLNKMAARENVATAKQLKDFKKGNDVKLIPPGPLGAQPKVIPSDVIPSFAYGRKSRPSTPINAVVGYQYAAEYEEALNRGYDTYQTIQDRAVAKHRVRLTKASKTLITNSRTQRNMSLSEEPKELFKLTKFKKVPSRLHLEPIGLSKAQSAPNLHEPVQELA
mmetsp:Transcript_64369/g.112332  ORF Transcript_64369/g.112332 Transcript_64369/m.112332 type:complete len:234 (+) Transcript_64369:150-851(+)